VGVQRVDDLDAVQLQRVVLGTREPVGQGICNGPNSIKLNHVRQIFEIRTYHIIPHNSTRVLHVRTLKTGNVMRML
jgi:hypothetical protein